MHHRGRRILAWLLTAAVTLGSNSVIVLAENIDPSETQAMEEEAAVTETEENQEQDIQADIPVMEEDENGEAFDEIGGLEETETDEIVPENEDETELQEEELFSAGDGEKSDPEDYRIWFSELRVDDYSTFIYNDERSYELKLDTENLNGKNAEIAWEVGLRKEEKEEDPDSFISIMGWSPDRQFWNTKAGEIGILRIDGEKLYEENIQREESAAYRNYWFEVRAYVVVDGERVYQTEAGLHSREFIIEYYLPEDQLLLPGWRFDIDEEYEGFLDNEAHPEGTNFGVAILDAEVHNAESETDEDPVCTIEKKEHGWQIEAQRSGTAEVILTYRDYAWEAVEHRFFIYVNGDKYILEPQWPASGNRMTRNSEMKASFVLWHEWKYSDQEEGSEQIEDWTLEFAPDENGWIYDTNSLRSVDINGHEVTVKAGDSGEGSHIRLKAMIPSENGSLEEAASENVYIDVLYGYDVLYPETIRNINVGEELDLSSLGMRVEHVDQDGETTTRDDVKYEYEYDEEQWKNIAPDGAVPVLKRMTAEDTSIVVIARDEDDNELDRREYRFNPRDYSIWFENLREDDYWTYVFTGEDHKISANVENLGGTNAEIKWKVGYRSDTKEWVEAPEAWKFWEVDNQDSSKITIKADKLETAYRWLDKISSGSQNLWFEVRANVVVDDIVVSDEAAFGVGRVQKEEENYDDWFPVNDQRILKTDKIWIPAKFDCWVRNAEHPGGELVSTDITDVQAVDPGIVECQSKGKGKGWMLKPLSQGTAKINIKYNKLDGTEAAKEITIEIQDRVYWMEIGFLDNNNQILAGGSKIINVEVYYRDEENPERVKIPPSKYTLQAKAVNWTSLVADLVTDNENSQIMMKAEQADEQEDIEVLVKLALKEKDEDGEPIWAADELVYIDLVLKYEDTVELANGMKEVPDIGEKLDIMRFEPVLKRYAEITGIWHEVTENVRFRLEYDENMWTPTEETKNSLVPVLIRKDDRHTDIRLIAQENVYNPRYGRWKWVDVAERIIDIPAIACDHSWKVVEDIPATCIKTGKAHKVCEFCETEKEEILPVTGKHAMGNWKVTKSSSVVKEGLKERNCTVCGSAKETAKIAKLKPTITLNLPVKEPLPLQVKQSYQVVASKLAAGDKVVSWKSSNKKIVTVSSKGKITGKKKGKAVITVKLLSGKTTKFTVKVQNGIVETSSIKVVNKATGAKLPKETSLKVKKKLSLKTTVAPVTSRQKITYSSSNKKIAEVTSKGVITAKKKGTAVITVKSGKKTVKIKVKVK